KPNIENPLAHMDIDGVYEFSYGGQDLVEAARGINVDEQSFLTGEPVFKPTVASEQGVTFMRKLIMADEIQARKVAVGS
ncbi:MAG: hypothetical protein ABIA37_02765, partial [Candidatus Woesearchaeota archaeon]